MIRAHGRLIAKFDTSLSDLFLRRIWGIIVPLTAFGILTVLFIGEIQWVLTSEWMAERGRNNWNAVIDMLLFEPSFWGCILLFALIIFGLFFRKTYEAEVYERGLILMQKGKQKDRHLGYDEIADIEEITYTYRKFFIPVYQRRAVKISVKNEKRAITITAANMAKFRDFHKRSFDAFLDYLSENNRDR